MFIPINENNTHWYSACISFRHKRIEIYDSLLEVCKFNRGKPVELRKNTGTMLVRVPCILELYLLIHVGFNVASRGAWSYERRERTVQE